MFSKIAEDVQIKTTELFHIESAVNNLQLAKVCQARFGDTDSHNRTVQILKELEDRKKTLQDEIDAVVA
jgi:hypothetical protein